MRRETAIQLLGVWCRDSGYELRGLSFRLEAGEVATLVGPAAADKRMVVELLLGWRRPDRGGVSVLGQDPARAGHLLSARVGALLRIEGARGRRLPAHCFYQNGTFREIPRGDLAGLTRSLLAGPEILILEEPLAGLSGLECAAMRACIGRLAWMGRCLFITSRVSLHLRDCPSGVMLMHPDVAAA